MLDSNLLKFCIRNSLHSNQIVHRLLELIYIMLIYTHTQIFIHTHPHTKTFTHTELIKMFYFQLNQKKTHVSNAYTNF